MTHWLLEIAREEYPKKSAWDRVTMPTELAEQWGLIASLAGLRTDQLAATVARRYKMDLAPLEIPPRQVARIIPEKIAKQFCVVPLAALGDTLTVAVADPTDAEAVAQLRFVSGRKILRCLATPDDIDTLSTALYALAGADETVGALKLLNLDNANADEIQPSDTPIVNLGRELIRRAIEKRASDIHLHPFAGGGVVRYRVDGILQRIVTLPRATLDSLTRFFKSNARMDPTDTLVPQDGRASITLGMKSFDLRVSTLPASGGESLVIRLLHQSRHYRLETMNFSAATRAALRRACSASNGLFLLTGPTGSGKTTTLYSMLAAVNTTGRRIITVEEPVEYKMQGITQVDVNAKAGLTFAGALRSILRQDPDIILIGEIRDRETADIAVNAALTGHLVFSTLHTMDAQRAIPRLLELGISPAVLADTLIGIAAQRLLRHLCPSCRTPATVPYQPLEDIFFQLTAEPPMYRAAGCPACNYTGYLERFPVAEVIEVNDVMRASLINHQTDVESISRSLPSDWADVAKRTAGRIVSGDTTPEEAYASLGMSFWNDLSRRYQKTVPLQDALAQSIAQVEEKLLSAIVVTADPALGETVTAILREAGHESAWEPLPEAVRVMIEKAANVPILIVDASPAGQEAPAYFRQVRAALAWSGLPAIVLIDENMREYIDLLVTHGATDIVTKPIDRNRLVERVQAILNR